MDKIRKGVAEIMKRNLLVVAAALVVVGLVAGLAGAVLRAGDKFPDFKLNDLDGKSKTLKDYKGKVLLVDVWATWCPPCKMEIPELVKLYGNYKNKGVEIIGIATDKQGADKVKPFVEEEKVKYPILLDTTGEYAGRKLNIRGIPTLFVVDKTGVVRNVNVGYTQYAELEKQIKAVLAK